MFDRKKYKTFAKAQLKNRWPTPILITLITMIIMTLFETPTFISLLQNGYMEAAMAADAYGLREAYDRAMFNTSWFTTITQTIVGAILEVAALNVFLKMSGTPEKVSFSDFFDGLNNWWRAALAALWQFLWVFLWSLLFLIPGIIKAYAYSQMFYLITEYKDLSVTKAMKISMLITNGHKGDLFVMELSFLGWIFLCGLTFGIGLLWLIPYMEMTRINAYHALLKEAFESGKLSAEDFTE